MPSDKGLVSDPNEELVAELDVLRGEMGTLITDLREFVRRIRNYEYSAMDQSDLAAVLEEIING